MWRIKIRWDNSVPRDSSPESCSLARDFSAREKSPHNFWAYNPWSLKLWKTETSGVPGSSSSRAHAKTTWTHSLWAPVWGSKLKGIRDIWGKTELSSIRASAGGQVSPTHKCWQRPLFPSWALPRPNHKACRWVSYLRLHQPSSHCLLQPLDEALPHAAFRPTQAVYSDFSIWMAYLGLCFRFSYVLSNKQLLALASPYTSCHPFPPSSVPLAHLPQAWHCQCLALVHSLAPPGTSKPSTSSSHLQITL